MRSFYYKPGTSVSYVCNQCGQIVNLRDYSQSDTVASMYDQSLCFGCHYWRDLILRPLPDFQIINNQYFSFRPLSDNYPKENLDKSRIRHIITTDGQILSSIDYYNYGSIPEAFRDALPNTAVFITNRQYNFFQHNKYFECRHHGCWDRRTCLWFKGISSWNQIPITHKEGAEKCPMYFYKPKALPK